MKLTYCNPLAIEDVKSGRWLDYNLSRLDPRTGADYRSISDPSVVYHDGKWILYPSYGIAYVSEDFVNWRHVDVGVPHMRYSPAVVQFRGKWYLSGHGMTEVYSADDPLGPFTICGHLTDHQGNIFKVADGCYLNDDDRLYFYWHSSEQLANGERIYGTKGAECDPDAPWKLLSEPVWINKFDPSQEWQRFGEHNQNEHMGWIEGQWMIKIGKRYYLLYSGNGTRFDAYANGVAYSDEGPLSGFQSQVKHNPLTRKTNGLLRGAGHGSIVEGPNNTYWVFYTSIFCYYYRFERRIGMDPIGIDENGELFCPEVTETPQYAPGVLDRPELGNSVGLLPLTFMQIPTVSSAVPGRDGIYAQDDSVLTWWQPVENDPDKCITVPLDAPRGYRVESVRIVWRDVGMETLDGIDPGPFQYVVEYLAPGNKEEWKMLVDASENQRDLCIDYRQFAPVKASDLRLRILGSPPGIQPGLVSFTAFGRMELGEL